MSLLLLLPAPAAWAQPRVAGKAGRAGAHLLAAAPAAPAPEPPAVASIELHLPPGTDYAGLSELVAIRRGAPPSRREVRRTIERLFGTGRFADIVVSQREDADGLAIVIEATPRTYVDRIEIEGNRVLGTAALRRSLGLPEGRLEYYPEQMERLVGQLKATYRRVGYAEAEITYELQPGEANQTILDFQIKEGDPTRIASITVAGDPRLPMGEVITTLGLGPGSVLDLAALERGCEALRASLIAKHHYRARFAPPEISYGPQGAVVRLPISAGPPVELRFQGNRSLGAGELEAALGYAGDEPLDEPLIAQLAQRVAAYYKRSGFADVRVSWRDVRPTDRARSLVVFEIHEGQPLRVTSVDFEGNQHWDDDQLRARLFEMLREGMSEQPASQDAGSEMMTGQVSSSRSSAFAIDAAEVYFEPAYQSALRRILDLYRADGYLQAIAEMPVVLRDEHTRQAAVTIRIKEGPQTLVSEVLFPGAPGTVEPDALQRAVSVEQGQPLSSLGVEQSRLTLQHALAERGHLFARVEDEERFSPDRTSARVAFRIWPGPRVRVGRILVQGLVRTEPEMVLGALAVKEGKTLDPDSLALSQRNLARLGLFRSVSIRMDAPEMPEEVKDLYVTVEERKTIYITWGSGYSMVDGLRSFFEVGKTNLAGRGLQVQARGKLNYFKSSLLSDVRGAQKGLDAFGRRLSAGIQYPRLIAALPNELGLRLDLVHEREIRPSYIFQRNASIAGIDLVGAERGFSTTLQYELEGVDVARTLGAEANAALSRTDIERLRFEEGKVYLHSIRPSARLVFLDDPIDPHRGVMVSGSVELVQWLSSPHDEIEPFFFLKAGGQANAYIPLLKGSVLALSVAGGRIFPLDPEGTSRTIAPKRFFMGGAGTMRGFFDDSLIPEDRRQTLHEQIDQCAGTITKTGCSPAADALRSGESLQSDGGELYTLGRAELRVPLVSSFELALFFDTGNLWLDRSKYDPLKLRYAGGVGLRAVTPIGPAAIDLGFNLDPDKDLNEGSFVPHFSIGVF